MLKHNWTFDEDYVCCSAYLHYIYGEKENQNVNYLIYNLTLKLPNLSKGSIRMKLQNIKQICMKYNIVGDHMDIAPLSNYSEQCVIAFTKAFKDYVAELEKKLNKPIIEGGV